MFASGRRRRRDAVYQKLSDADCAQKEGGGPWKNSVYGYISNTGRIDITGIAHSRVLRRTQFDEGFISEEGKASGGGGSHVGLALSSGNRLYAAPHGSEHVLKIDPGPADCCLWDDKCSLARREALNLTASALNRPATLPAGWPASVSGNHTWGDPGHQNLARNAFGRPREEV